MQCVWARRGSSCLGILTMVMLCRVPGMRRECRSDLRSKSPTCCVPCLHSRNVMEVEPVCRCCHVASSLFGRSVLGLHTVGLGSVGRFTMLFLVSDLGGVTTQERGTRMRIGPTSLGLGVLALGLPMVRVLASGGTAAPTACVSLHGSLLDVLGWRAQFAIAGSRRSCGAADVEDAPCVVRRLLRAFAGFVEGGAHGAPLECLCRRTTADMSSPASGRRRPVATFAWPRHSVGWPRACSALRPTLTSRPAHPTHHV